MVLNWIAILQNISSRYPANVTVYPGHGGISTNLTQTALEDIGYLQYFLQQICIPGISIPTIIDDLATQYSTWSGADLLEYIAYNPVWPVYQNTSCGSVTTAQLTSAQLTSAQLTSNQLTSAVLTTNLATTASQANYAINLVVPYSLILALLISVIFTSL